MAAEAGLELPIGLTEQKFLQQLARIEARSIRAANRAEQAFKKSNESSARSFVALERSAGASFAKLQSLLRVGGGLLAGGVVANQIRQYSRLADAATQMRNSLRVIGLEGEDLSRVYEQLYRSAQKNSAPINSLVDLYSKLALTQKELGVSSQELIQFTDGIAVALRVGGTDAQAASGALLQLSQALGGGVVRAEEFNSILEGTPTIAQAVARGLKEANGSVAELRKLVVDGEVSSSAFFRAFEVGSEELRRQAETSQTTVGQSFVRIGNSLVTFIGEFDRASGVSDKFAQALGGIADGLDGIDAAAFVGKITTITSAIAGAEEATANWLRELANAQAFADLNAAMGLTEGGQLVNPDVSEAEGKIEVLEKEIAALQAQIENNTSLGFDNTEAIARLNEVRSALAALRAEAANMPRYVDGLTPTGKPVYNMTESGTGVTSYSAPPKPPSAVVPVSIADFPAGGTGGGGGSKGGRGRKSGGGKGKTERPFFEDVERNILNLQREAEMVGKSTKEVATAEARWAMLDEAKKRGLKVNEKLNSQIEAQAAKVGQLTAELERAEIAQQQFDEAVDGIADAFAGAIVAGESLREGLAQVFKQIASDILQSGIREALGSVFDAKGGGTSLLGNIFGGIFKGGPKLPSFDGGGFTGYGPRSGGIDGIGGIPAIVHPNETIVDHSKGQRMGSQSIALTIDLRGTTGDAALDQKIAQAGQKILQQVPSVMDNVNKRQR